MLHAPRTGLPAPHTDGKSGADVGRLPLAALALVPLFAGCLVQTAEPNLVGQDVPLTIIHTADIHSRLFPYAFAPGAIDKGLGLVPTQGTIAHVGGIARIASVVACIRGDQSACNTQRVDRNTGEKLGTVSDYVGGSSSRVIHLDSGDIFEGAPVFNTFGGEVEMRAMMRLGLNAMALGNHEFDKGSVNLELMKENFGGFPILAANYRFSDPSDPTQPKLELVIAPFALFNVQGLRIGVIGMGNLSSLQGIIDGSNSLGVLPIDATTAIQNTVGLIRGSVDVVILVSHLGLDEDEGVAQTTNVQDQNPVVDGVDVILGGHLHIVLDPPKDLPRYNTPDANDPGRFITGHTVLCHSGAFAKYVGRLDLSFHVADPAVPGDRNTVKSYTYKLIPIDDSLPDDVGMLQMLEPYQLQMNTLLNLTHDYAVVSCDLTQSTCPKVTRSDPDGNDSQLGNLVAASMRFHKGVEADFGLTNSLGIRADFESGPLNLEEMYNVFPFDNTITTMYLSGKEIAEMMDFVAARSSDRSCKTQSQVSGLWSVLDCRARTACGPFDVNLQAAEGCLPRHACGPDAAHLASCDDTQSCVMDACVCTAGTNKATGACNPPDTTRPRECGASLAGLVDCQHGQACLHGQCVQVDGPFLLGDACLHEEVLPGGAGCTQNADCAVLGNYYCAPTPTGASLSTPRACRRVCTPALPAGEYRVAVNDYIAAGGSGFAVLKRNTSKFNTGISLRDSLLDYIGAQGTRCDPMQNQNIAYVQCMDKDVTGTPQPVNCTIAYTDAGTGKSYAACCHDPVTDPSAPPPACSTTSAAFRQCVKDGRQPTILYDYSSLPCLVPGGNPEAHDGRITMKGGS